MAPTYNDWEFVHSIFPFLEIFYDATLCISGSSYATSTMYMFEAFGIGMKIKEMSTSRGVNMSVRTMVVRMKEKYDKYWGNPNRGELTYKLRDKVESSLRSLLEEYSRGGDEFEVNSQEA
ncbi:Zinc finger BED domain-containing protein RICESLEEPER 1 [Glycine soja]